MPDTFINIGHSPHVLIPFWIAVGLVVLAVVLVIVWLRLSQDDPYTMADFWALMTSAFAAMAVAAVVISLIPFDAKYHHLWSITAEVESVTNGLTDGSGDLTSAPVVDIGKPFDLVVTDPRINNLEGATVTFTCGVEWIYAAADRYNCAIADVAR